MRDRVERFLYPPTSTFTFANMLAPLRASIKAMSCGVETMTAPGPQLHARTPHVSLCKPARMLSQQSVLPPARGSL